jgi:hypothetical protein
MLIISAKQEAKIGGAPFGSAQKQETPSEK